MDTDTTRKFGRLLSAVGELGEDLHGQGVIDLEQVRLTIAARRSEAKRRVANGESIRGTAKKLGVSKETVRRDLGLVEVAQIAPKVAQIVPLPECAEERWLVTLKGFAYDAARLRSYFNKEFPNWENYKVASEEIYALVDKAVSEWSEIELIIRRMSENA